MNRRNIITLILTLVALTAGAQTQREITITGDVKDGFLKIPLSHAKVSICKSDSSISALKFDEKGLIPAIVIDHDTKQVLTLAYMNRQSLEISLERKLTCFWSRSRQKLWLKGETSGNFQHIVSITSDCDDDALLVEVIPDGPACHTGTFSCFTHKVF